ncbi:alpha/beta hydrolase family protein [Streptomyces sp. NPDC096311]|uniref:alpha/beta hydrolase family protein n=1 Tax=Streptomyces sp. NPDC096311 TaxID=3366083 RepID=UPI00380546FF
MHRQRLMAIFVGLPLVVVVGCTRSDNGGTTRAGETPTRRPASAEASTSTPAPTSARVDPVSIPGLIKRPHHGSDLRLGSVLARNDAYTRYAITYRSDGLTISGIMNIPRGKGPFPAVVLAHGYIDPATYTTGQGTPREQDLLARRGYVVLHTDYRNHAGSGKDPDNDVDLRLGYTQDVIGAVLALRSSGRPEIDGNRVGLLGRSEGGGVVYNTLVVAPGLVDAAVVYAPVSSRPAQNVERFQRHPQPGWGPPDPVVREIDKKHGTPRGIPAFWKDVAPVTYADRMTEPLLIQHGTADNICPVAWSEQTAAAFRAAGKDVELRKYPGEGHTFGPRWRASMDVTLDFFAQHLH